MSFLSDQQPASPFPDYAEVCQEPSPSPTEPAHTWDWQPPPSLDTRTQRGPMLGGGAPATAALTHEDKLRVCEELKLPGSPSLGSVGQSPVSPLSSSLSASLACPEGLSPGRACGGASASPEPPRAMGASLTGESLANVDSLSEAWNNLAAALNAGAAGVSREKHVETSEEEEEEVTVDSPRESPPPPPVLLVHAELQRAVVTLELPARYPGEQHMEPNQPVSTIGRSGCSPNSLQRSPTGAEAPPPTPPCCHPAGVPELHLWQGPPEPRLSTPPLPLLHASEAASPSPLNDPVEDWKAEKELGGIGRPAPPRSQGVSGFGFSSPPSAAADAEEGTGVHPPEFAAFHHANANSGLEASDRDVVVRSGVGGDSDGGLPAGSFSHKGAPSCCSFLPVDGRWSLVFIPLLR